MKDHSPTSFSYSNTVKKKKNITCCVSMFILKNKTSVSGIASGTCPNLTSATAGGAGVTFLLKMTSSNIQKTARGYGCGSQQCDPVITKQRKTNNKNLIWIAVLINNLKRFSKTEY